MTTVNRLQVDHPKIEVGTSEPERHVPEIGFVDILLYLKPLATRDDHAHGQPDLDAVEPERRRCLFACERP